ncbi:MAG: hypothetical protein WA919_15770 [Coleofasciculaceae cyanobacterium]
MIKLSKPKLGSNKQLFSLLFTAFFLTGNLPVLAQTRITNSASASGSNLPGDGTVDSNETEIFAAQASLELIKTADRAAAEPGDTVIYRLQLRNTGTVAARDLIVTDRLPLGLRFLSESVEATISDERGANLPVAKPEVTSSKRTVTFTFPSNLELPAGGNLNLFYAAVVTPDAIRGDGRNVAQERRSNVASHLVRIRPGILSDCGTLVGRVFVDKNFDGEQQPGEPGVPNAVIYMDDGNRITTDANGLFSLANVIAGHRSATLDLSSLPGYSLAPNLYFIESNSQSRLVRLEAGGMARLNFAVTPAYGEERQ